MDKNPKNKSVTVNEPKKPKGVNDWHDVGDDIMAYTTMIDTDGQVIRDGTDVLLQKEHAQDALEDSGFFDDEPDEVVFVVPYKSVSKEVLV